MKLPILMALALAASRLTAIAQPYGQGPGRDRDPTGYYSQTDQNGYYDRSGRYRRFGEFERRGYRPDYDRQDNSRDYREDRRAGSGSYYQQGVYEQNCRRGNGAAGTIFGALAGGAIGAAASRGNGGAVIGGAVVGGILGNVISQDIDCDDQPYAYGVYSNGLNGEVGRRYDWEHGQARGYFTPTRNYRRGGVECRDFTATTYRGGRELTRTGTACRAEDGNWHFD